MAICWCFTRFMASGRPLLRRAVHGFPFDFSIEHLDDICVLDAELSVSCRASWPALGVDRSRSLGRKSHGLRSDW